MNRRRILTSIGLLAGGGLAGCLGSDPGGSGVTTTDPGSTTTTPGEPTTDPGGNQTPMPDGPQETLAYNGGPDLDGVDADFPQRSAGSLFLGLATERSHASALATALENDQAESFLDETSFDESAVICFQDATGQSSPDLSPTSLSYHGQEARLAVEYPGNAGTSDIIANVLLVRVSRSDGAPRHTTVDFEGTTISTIHGARLDQARDVVVQNRDCSDHRVEVNAFRNDGLVYRTGFDDAVGAGQTVRHRDVITEAGEYTVQIGGDVRADPFAGTLSNDDERGVLVTVDGDGNADVSLVSEPDLPEAGTGSCAAAELPYESSDPAENADTPAKISWVSDSSKTRTVQVTVRDGSRPVLDRQLALGAGKKGRTEPLIAKMGTYATTIDPSDGDPLEVGWQVTQSGGDLQILVESDGEIQVGGSVEN